METTALFIIAVILVVLVQIAGVLVYTIFDLGRVITSETMLQYRKRRFKKAKRAHTLQTLRESMK